MKKNKTGCKTGQNVGKEIREAVKFSKTEHFIIPQKTPKAAMKISTYARQIRINGMETTRLSKGESHFVRQLIGMANNISQLSNFSNS